MTPEETRIQMQHFENRIHRLEKQVAALIETERRLKEFIRQEMEKED